MLGYLQANDWAPPRGATRNVPVAAAGDPVDAVLAGMRGRLFDSVAVVAVCDSDRLVGLATLERLLAAAPATAVDDVMAGLHPSSAHTPTRNTRRGRPSSTANPAWPSSMRRVASVASSRRNSCWESCWRSTTRTSLASAATFAPPRLLGPPAWRACLEGCGTACPGSPWASMAP